MRDLTDIHVERVVVHIVDHHKWKEPVLSQAELALDKEPRLQNYFDAQVNNVLHDSATSSAVFAAKGRSAVADLCYAILLDPKHLIASSQQLAGHLFNAMGTSQRIAPGSLAVALFTASNYRNKLFLGLIKIDPSEVLVQKIEKDARGRRVVNFDVRGDAMPTAREKLQKAALILPKRRGAEYDMLLLDRQVAKVAADFFAKAFLNVTPVLDARALTERFYIGVQSAYNELTQPPQEGQPRLTVEQADVFRQQIDSALQTQSLEIDDWVSNLNLPAETKPLIAKHIATQIPADRQFGIDTAYAEEKLTKKYRFRGDYGVLIEVEAAHHDDVIKAKEELPQPDGKLITRLVLEVPGLRWVKK